MTLISSTSFSDTVGVSDSMRVPTPLGTRVGDLLTVFIGVTRDTGSGALISIAPPDGWVERAANISTSQVYDASVYVWTYDVAAGPPPYYEFVLESTTTQGGEVAARAFTHRRAAFDAVASGSFGSTGWSTPAVTAGANPGDILFMAALQDDALASSNTGVSFLTSGTGFTVVSETALEGATARDLFTVSGYQSAESGVNGPWSGDTVGRADTYSGVSVTVAISDTNNPPSAPTLATPTAAVGSSIPVVRGWTHSDTDGDDQRAYALVRKRVL